MAIQKKYLKSSEGAIASYSYTDLAEATGVVSYYLFNGEDSSAEFYGLTSNSSFYSKNEFTGAIGVGQNGNYAKKIERDFDIEFNLPKIIKGTAYTNIFVDVYDCNTTDNTSVYVVCALKKVSGSDVTTIVSGQSDTDTMGDTGGDDRRNFVIALDISSPEHFKKADKLRVHIEVWANIATGNGEAYIRLCADPAARGNVVDSLPSNSNILIPFRIDL